MTSSSYSIWGCILKGCLERGIFRRAKSHLKGIEDFNLEHWSMAFRKFEVGLDWIWSGLEHDSTTMDSITHR